MATEREVRDEGLRRADACRRTASQGGLAERAASRGVARPDRRRQPGRRRARPRDARRVIGGVDGDPASDDPGRGARDRPDHAARCRDRRSRSPRCGGRRGRARDPRGRRRAADRRRVGSPRSRAAASGHPRGRDRRVREDARQHALARAEHPEPRRAGPRRAGSRRDRAGAGHASGCDHRRRADRRAVLRQRRRAGPVRVRARGAR